MSERHTYLPEPFHKGRQAFNQQNFYEAHEHFEEAWRGTDGEPREFFRAFIHISGGFYRLTQNRLEAARKFFSHAQKWLKFFPGSHHGYDINELKQNIEQLIEAIDCGTQSKKILEGHFQPIQPREGSNQ